MWRWRWSGLYRGGGASFGSGPGKARGVKIVKQTKKRAKKPQQFGIKTYPYTID